jgi:hypothetical protein
MNDIYSDQIAEQIRAGRGPRPPKKTASRAEKVRALCILVLAVAALGVSLAAATGAFTR